MLSVIRPIDETAHRLVLVADDEPAMRAIIAGMLVDLSLVPLLVGDGAAAIAAVEAHRSELVCAILDIAMPGGNGVDAAHVIQLIAPKVALVLMCDPVPANCAGRITRLRLAGLLQKPFPVATLRALIQHAVADGGAPGECVEASDARPHNVEYTT